MKFDELYNKLMTENEVTEPSYHVYDVTVSGRHSEVSLVNNSYTVPAMSIKDAQTKALNNYVKEVGEVDEFAEIVPAKSNDVGIVNTSEESMLIVSKNELSEDQINDIVYQDPGDDMTDEYEHKGWAGDGTGEDDFADYNQNEGNDY
jgi:hypothetical protein